MTSTPKPRIPIGASSQLSVDFSTLEFLSPGTSGIIYTVDDDRVLKEYYDLDGGNVECRALDRLGSHPNIIGYFGQVNSKSIILERGTPLSSLQTATISVPKQMAWIRDVAEGLQYMHQRGIIHADVGCENMVIVGDRLKIIDFEGCSIDGDEATAGYKWYNRRDLSADSQSDIFAFGCVIYQMLTGRPTFHELAESGDRSNVARRLWAEHRFPKVQGLPLSDVMLGCWSGHFKSMGEVISALDSTWTTRLDAPRLTMNIRGWISTWTKYVRG
ncbi:hypothetical protein AK830_g11100 [Neonectria ditissima]|uniref:Protein kinase domain-containing protein n=1 Tax=Neonectria ditissima TaxID=78410 RepID=A0A0P7ANB2_9HYPO|nr:hypothetical protein AK830_g11100 [Neonectria ditissima]